MLFKCLRIDEDIIEVYQAELPCEPVKYEVRDQGSSVLVTIENTRIMRHNDTRPLDVHFFDSPIGMVRARQVRRNVEVEIQLKSQAPYQATQNGPEVQLTFNRGG